MSDIVKLKDQKGTTGFSLGKLSINSLLKDPLVLTGILFLFLYYIQKKKQYPLSEMTKEIVNTPKADIESTSQGQDSNQETINEVKDEEEPSILSNILQLRLGEKETGILNAVKPYLSISHQAIIDIALKTSEIINSSNSSNKEVKKQDLTLPKLSNQVSGLLGVVRPYMGVMEQSYVEILVKALEIFDIVEGKMKVDKVNTASTTKKDVGDDDLIQIFSDAQHYLDEESAQKVRAVKNVFEINKIVSKMKSVESTGYSTTTNIFEPSKIMEIARAVKPYLSDNHQEMIDRGLQFWMLANAAEIQKNISNLKSNKEDSSQKKDIDINNDVQGPLPNFNPPSTEENQKEERVKDVPPVFNQQNIAGIINAMKTMLTPEDREKLDRLNSMFNTQQKNQENNPTTQEGQ